MPLQDLENIFGEQKTPTKTTQPKQPKAISGLGALEDIFRGEAPQIEQLAIEQPRIEEKGLFSKGLDFGLNTGKTVVKKGLDAWNWLQTQNDKAAMDRANMTRSLSRGLVEARDLPIDQKQKLLTKYKPYETFDEYQADTPIIKFLNKPITQKVIGEVAETTSNMPLKGFATIKAIGDDTYEQAYQALLDDRNNPENGTFKKFMYELQDSAPQTAIGVLLAVGTGYLTRSTTAAQAVSGAYYTALSANEQLQSRGKVESLGNIGIDVIGDQILGNMLLKVFKTPAKSLVSTMAKSFGIEGGTEISQSLIKYSNDYANAKTEEKKKEILSEAMQYVSSGQMLMEFAVGGVSGAAIGAGVEIAGKKISPEAPSIQPKKTLLEQVKAPEMKKLFELTKNSAEIRNAITTLEKEQRIAPSADKEAELVILNDHLADYQTAFKDRTVDIRTGADPILQVETVEYDDGKVAFSFTAKAGQNEFSMPFLTTELSNTKEEATQAALDAVKAWASSRIETAEQADLAGYRDLLKSLDKAQKMPANVLVSELVEEKPIIKTEEAILEEIMPEISPEVEAQATEDWTENYAERFGDLASRASEIQTKLKEAKKDEKSELEEELQSINTEMGNMEQEFVDKYVKEEKPTKPEEKITKEEAAKALTEKIKQEEIVEKRKKLEILDKELLKKEKVPKIDKEKIIQKEKELQEKYKGKEEKAQEALAQILTELEVAEAGQRIFIRNERGYDEVKGIPSTFPKWIPEHLRSKDLFNKIIFGDLENIKYPSKGNQTRQRALYDILMDEIDKRVGVDTKSIRKGIINLYGQEKLEEVDTDSIRGELSESEKAEFDKAIINIFEKEEKPAEEKPIEKEVKFETPSGLAMAMYKTEDLPEFPILMGGMENVRAIELPEMVDLARELMGDVPSIVKKTGKAAGRFYGEGAGRIKLIASLFEKGNLPQASRVLAHEIGHLIDYLPDQFLKRGNLIGHLHTLRGFMGHYFGTEGALDTKALRKAAEREILSEEGVSISEYIKDKSIRERLKPLIKERYGNKITETGGIKNADIRKELLVVTRYWHPYDPAKVPASYKRYRESSVELYAEAISMLFNSPGLLEQMAPIFYTEFFNALDNKPEVKEAYFGLQELLSKDRKELLRLRRAGINKMFDEGDYKSGELQKKRMEEKKKRASDLMFRARFELVDKNSRIIDKVADLEKQGVFVNPDDNPVYYLEERNYLGGKIKAIMERDFNPVYQTLNDKNISWSDFGEYLFYQRIASGDRSEVANPRGITPDAANELIDIMHEEYGEQFEILEKQADKFRTALKKIAEEAYKEGLYTPELYAQMQENPAYVTFQVIEHIETGMSSKVYKSIGTLKDITNPADASLLKMIATVKAIERNKVKKKTIDFLKSKSPTDIKEAKTRFTGKGKEPIPSRLPNEELVTYYDGGKLQGVYVDPYIAKSLENESIGSNNALIGTLKFFNGHLFRPLFITFNLGFQSFNLIRDFTRFYKNIPDMTIYRALKRYSQAARISKVRAFGLPKNPSKADIEAQNIIQTLEYDKVFSVTFNDLLAGEQVEDKQIDRILRESGIDSFRPEEGSKYLKAPRAILKTIENLGNLIETLPKAAGYYELTEKNKGEPLTKDQQSFIRKNIGSPDFLAGGFIKPATNEIFLFSNAITQGIRSDLHIATNPKTRAGFWWKTAKISFLPKIIMMAALAGLFGEALKKMFEDVSEYDMTNYNIIPIGRDEKTGKTIYFRMPTDETTRFLGGIFWKILTVASNEQNIVKDITDIISYTGGQLPSISPILESGAATMQFVAGQNPYDAFRGRQVLSQDVYKAGGWDATKAFLGWQFQQLGGGVFYRFYHEPIAPKEMGTAEKVVNLPIVSNIAGRFIRVSDYGKQEKLRGVQKRVEKEEAKTRLDEKKIVNKYLEEAQSKKMRFSNPTLENNLVKEIIGHLPQTKDEQDKARRIVKKFRLGLTRGGSDASVVALIDADTNKQKIEILKRIKDSMKADDFSVLKANLLREKIISSDIFYQIK